MDYTMNTTPRIYVGTYAKYNSGSIEGAWLDVEDYSDKEEFYEACAALHPTEDDPEFMFQDMEGIPEGMAGESFVKDELFEYAAMDEDDRELLSVYREHVDSSADIEQAKDHYRGRYVSAADYAQEYYEECGEEIPAALANYIDWESLARDMGFGGYTFAEVSYRDVWVFSS